jgi:hypothetical protein
MINTAVQPQVEAKTGTTLPRIMLHLEGLAMLMAALVLYSRVSGEWGAFVLLLLTPDLSALGYLAGVRVGSITYNAVHFYAAPIALGLVSLLGGWSLGLSLALIWFAHIGMDRLLGYGLKYPTNFKDTHIGRS